MGEGGFPHATLLRCHPEERFLFGLLVALEQGLEVRPPASGRNIRERQVLPRRGPGAPVRVPDAAGPGISRRARIETALRAREPFSTTRAPSRAPGLQQHLRQRRRTSPRSRCFANASSCWPSRAAWCSGRSPRSVPRSPRVARSEPKIVQPESFVSAFSAGDARFQYFRSHLEATGDDTAAMIRCRATSTWSSDDGG